MRKKETDLKIIQERYQKRLDRQNNYNKSKYDNISIVLPFGSKEKLLSVCREKGYKNISDYFKQLVKNDGVILENITPKQYQDGQPEKSQNI